MIIDIHTHMFPPDICNNRQKYFQGEPEFRLLYDNPKSELIGASELLRNMDDQGIDKSVVFGFPWNNLEISRLQNDYIMKMADAHPDRLIGFCCLNPAHPEAAREVERCIQGGLKGVGELAFYQSGFDDRTLDALSPVMALCEEKGLPVLIHTNEPVGHLYPGKAPMTLLEIYRMVQRFPRNTLILAHWGGGLFFYHLMKNEVKDALKRVYVDTAASPYLYDIAIYPIAGAAFGCDRILMGSDFPLLKPARYIRDMKKAGVSEDALLAISGGNAVKVLGLSPGC
jgi:predicted TIM-barrel fold metal-dependent hydrolase